MNTLIELIWEQKITFLGTFFVVLTGTYVFLAAVDFLPEPPPVTEEMETDETKSLVGAAGDMASSTVAAPIDATVGALEAVTATATVQPEEVSALPVSIVIKKLDKTIVVHNPTSRAIAALDAALLDGVVRHPDSATLTQDGAMFLLGHSSYLPHVFNKNFQAFNGIQDLQWGDEIDVISDTSVYHYRVDKVYRAKAQEVTVPIAGSERTLTLATCNSFGSVDDRYIVEATQVGVDLL